MDKEKILIEYTWLIKCVTSQLYKSLKLLGFEYDDLEQEAMLFVYENLDNYDESIASLKKFINNYAMYGILYFVGRNRSFAHVPSYLNIDAGRLMNANAKFYKKNNRNMTREEMLNYIITNFKGRNIAYDLEYVDTLLYINKFCVNNKWLGSEYLEGIDISGFEDQVLDAEILRNALNYLKKLIPDGYDTYVKCHGLLDGVKHSKTELAKKNGIKPQAISSRLQTMDNRIKTRKEAIRKLIMQ